MKILIATPLYPPDIGGPATYAKILALELPKRGVHVEIVSYGAVRHLPKIFGYPFYAFKVFWRAKNADLVLALDPVHTGLSGWLAAAIWRKKFIVKIVGDYAWEQGTQRFGVKETLDEFVKKPSREFLLPVRILRRVQTFVARKAERIIVPSKYLKDIISSWGISPEKITVVYNAFGGVGEVPTKEECRRELGLSGTMFLSAGRLVSWKGFDLLLNVIVEIQKEVPDAKLYIAGDGPERMRIENMINGLLHFLPEKIMLGNVPHEKLMKYIRAADCFVLNTGYEGLSHQLLEVLVVGTPIVTTNVGGNPELVQDGVTGRLIPPPGDTAANILSLYNAIMWVLKNPSDSQAMSQAGKQFASTFTIGRMVEETKKVLEELLSTI